MSQTTGVTVPFTKENIDNCICPSCPVQAGSRCADDGLKKLKETLRKAPIPAEEVPSLPALAGGRLCDQPKMLAIGLHFSEFEAERRPTHRQF